MSAWDVSRSVATLIESNKETEILQILLTLSVDQRRFIVAIQHQDSSLLFHAVRNQLQSVVIYLLKRCKADPNGLGVIHGKKITCLAVATLIDSPILVKILLHFKADTEIAFESNEETVLSYACNMERVKIVQVLIEHGANLNRQDLLGKSCLMASVYNLELFKLLVSVGADINLADKFGITCLVLALKNNLRQLVDFLLDLENTQVRLHVHTGSDSLYPAIQFCRKRVIKRIINKGGYTTAEVARIYELQSCRYQVINAQDKARKLWREALKLRGKPIGTPMFEAPRLAGKLQEVLHLFNVDDIPTLRFVESVSGFSLHTAYICVLATWNVKQPENYISLCKFFFAQMQSVKDGYFFRILLHGARLVEHFFTSDSVKKSHGLEVFDLFVDYIEGICFRLRRMTSQKRSVHGFKIEYLMIVVIKCLYQIHWKFPEDIGWLSNSLKRLIRLDLRGPSQKSLFQKCAISCTHLIERFFLARDANVNNSDRLGKTVLNDLAETANPSPYLIGLIIDHGFNFSEVKYEEYCLPCRLRSMNLLPNPVKHTTLQCLAVQSFCQHKMKSFDEAPGHFLQIVKSHLLIGHGNLVLRPVSFSAREGNWPGLL